MGASNGSWEAHPSVCLLYMIGRHACVVGNPNERWISSVLQGLAIWCVDVKLSRPHVNLSRSGADAIMISSSQDVLRNLHE